MRKPTARSPHHPDLQERQRKKVTKLRCVSANRRRPWRSEVELIPNLDTLCHVEHTGPILSSLGAPFLVEQDSGTTAEKSDMTPYGDDSRPENTSFGCGSAQNITEHTFPSRENTQKAITVSLCIEDEMKKSDNKIISVRQKTIRGPFQNVSETHPIIYNNHINNLSDFQRKLITRPIYFLSSKRPMSNPFPPPGAGPVLPNKMDYTKDFLRNRQLGLHNAMLKKSKTKQRSSSDNMKIILHYLSADGSKQRVEMAKEGNVAKQKLVKNPANGKNMGQDGKSIHISSPTYEKDEEYGVGPVINGMNPMKVTDDDPSLHGRSHHVSRLYCPNSARSSSSPIPRPNSVREIHNWSYITISKPLSPLEGPLEPLQKKKLSSTVSPELEKDMVMPTSGMRSMMFTTKSVILENRNEKPGSFPIEVNPLGTYLGWERSTEGSQEESKMEGGATVKSTYERGQPRTTPELEFSEMTGSENDSNEEKVQKWFSIPVHPNTSPVINIPTAPTDSSE
ncbi:uncharacterized protein LOC142657045 isoform X2 [Rhinoderma darwinii]|uniref:uncharacterized protein LOC142657045 isoform X2 n=1 Tax=Rhinoderma darwinii TaxID=43563 RepID=UPI003F6796DB